MKSIKNRFFDLLIISTTLTLPLESISQEAIVYEVPPSGATMGGVPDISEDAMRECVLLYNEAKTLYREIQGTHVNQYSSSSVEHYNALVEKHSLTIDRFNSECAGKRAASAARTTEKLNQGNQHSE